MLKETLPQVANLNNKQNLTANVNNMDQQRCSEDISTRFNTLNEIITPLDWISASFRFPELLSLPKGDGRSIVLVPGNLSEAQSMCSLGKFLKYLGYQVFNWEHGTHNRLIEDDTKFLAKQLDELRFLQRGNAVTLIGWDLGGVLIREVARLFQSDVHQVITLGTPITGGPKSTTCATSYAHKHKLDLDKYEAYVNTCNRIGLSQPVSSIYSKEDNIVDWTACVDTYNDQAHNIEVDSSHDGLVTNSQVWEIIAQELGNHPLISTK